MAASKKISELDLLLAETDGTEEIVVNKSGTTYRGVVSHVLAWLKSPITTLGDLIVGGASGINQRLPIGANGNVLTVTGGVPAWGAPTLTPPGGSTTQIQFNNAGAFGGSSTLTWNSGTNTLTATNLVGALTGNVTGNVSGSALSITGVNAVANGGTSFATYTIGDILQASAAGVLSKLAAVATGNALISGGVGAVSSWGKIGLTTHVSGVLPAANGGTGAATLTGYVKGTGTGVMTAAASIPVADISGTLPVGSGGTSITTYATGDLIYATGTNTLGKLAAGSNTNVLTLAGGVPTWAAPAAGGMTNPMTTAGDIIYGGASGTPTRLAIAAATNVLIGGASAPAWSDFKTIALGTALTGFAAAGNTAIDSASSILVGFQRAQGQINARYPTTGGAIGGRAYTTPVTVTFSATPTFNASTSNVFYLNTAQTANITTLAISNGVDGQTVQIRIKQDGTGGRTIGLDTNIIVDRDNTPSTEANAVNWLIVTYVGTESRWEGAWSKIRLMLP